MSALIAAKGIYKQHIRWNKWVKYMKFSNKNYMHAWLFFVIHTVRPFSNHVRHPLPHPTHNLLEGVHRYEITNMLSGCYPSVCVAPKALQLKCLIHYQSYWYIKLVRSIHLWHSQYTYYTIHCHLPVVCWLYLPLATTYFTFILMWGWAIQGPAPQQLWKCSCFILCLAGCLVLAVWFGCHGVWPRHFLSTCRTLTKQYAASCCLGLVFTYCNAQWTYTQMVLNMS